jgi:hypothetical protein
MGGAVADKKMDFRILGSFEVCAGERLVELGGEKPRALLAILLLHRDEVVSAARLIDDLWGESPPDTALRTLRAYVSRLRKALSPNGASPSGEPESACAANGRFCDYLTDRRYPWVAICTDRLGCRPEQIVDERNLIVHVAEARRTRGGGRCRAMSCNRSLITVTRGCRASGR